MDRALTVAALLSIALVLMVIQSLRRAHIRVEYSMSWLLAGISIYVLSQWQGALQWLGELMGIRYPPAALAAIAMGAFLLVLFRFSMILSGLKDGNIALAQKVAILEFELRRLREQRAGLP